MLDARMLYGKRVFLLKIPRRALLARLGDAYTFNIQHHRRHVCAIGERVQALDAPAGGFGVVALSRYVGPMRATGSQNLRSRVRALRKYACGAGKMGALHAGQKEQRAATVLSKYYRRGQKPN
eukprot:5022325-Pleurochrysis_carterae.AAC.6